MILVFIFLGIIIFVNVITLIFILSNINIQIKKLHIFNVKETINVDFILDISIKFLNKIKILKITIDNDKIKDKLNFSKVNLKKIKDHKEINKLIIKEIKKVEVNIDYFKLEGYFSCFNSIIALKIYTIIQIIIPYIIANKLRCQYTNKLQFLNINQNTVNVNLSCIISLKIVNIINALIRIKRKGGKDIYGRSSNRKSYAYSNE